MGKMGVWQDNLNYLCVYRYFFKKVLLSRGLGAAKSLQNYKNIFGELFSETGIGGGQNAPNARGEGNLPRKSPLEDLDF